MKKYMSNEEFSSCHTIEHRDFNEINEELGIKKIQIKNYKKKKKNSGRIIII